MYCSLHAAAATAAAHREVAVGALELIAAPAVHAQDVHASAYAGASREKQLINKQNTHPQLLVYSEFLSDIAATYSNVSTKFDVGSVLATGWSAWQHTHSLKHQAHLQALSSPRVRVHIAKGACSLVDVHAYDHMSINVSGRQKIATPLPLSGG